MAKKAATKPTTTVAKQVDALTQAQQALTAAIQQVTTNVTAVQTTANTAQTTATAAQTAATAAQAAAVRSATEARNSWRVGIVAAVVVVLLGLIVIFFVDHGAKKSAMEATESATAAAASQTAAKQAETNAGTAKNDAKQADQSANGAWEAENAAMQSATQAQTAAEQAQLAATRAEEAQRAAETARTRTVPAPAATPSVDPALLDPLSATPGVSVSALCDDLASEDPGTVDEAVRQLSMRPDAVPMLAERFADGNKDVKKRAWSCLRSMGEPARTRLNDMVAHPNRWRAKVVAAAREILTRGFRHDVDAEDAQARAEEATKVTEKNRKKIEELSDQFDAVQKELREAVHKLKDLSEHAKNPSQATIDLANELRAKVADLGREQEVLGKKLRERGFSKRPVTVNVLVPEPTGVRVTTTYPLGYASPASCQPCR